jgi:exosortase
LNPLLTQTQPVTARSDRWLARTVLVVAAIGALWFILFRQLSNEWSVNEQYSYGWFVPFFALFLFWLRWEDRPDPEVRSQRSEVRSQRSEAANNRRALVASLIAIPALLLLLPVRLFEIANPDWRLLDWLHAAAVTTLTLLYVWYIGGAPWLRHFAFPILFASIAVPWVTPIEVPIVQGLMHAVAGIASEAATLFGIPAHVEGNLIRTLSGVVGINEACSGVRSLQTSLMIGLLLGELKRLSIWRRVALVAGAIAIAFIGNCARAFFLVWIAGTKGIAAVGHWHDVAGYSIVAAVFVGSLLLTILLGRGKAEVGSQKSERSYFLLPTFYFLLSLCWLAFVEIGCEAWYRAHERNVAPLPRWTVHWPKDAPGFHEIEIDEHVRGALRYNDGHKAAWDVTPAKLGESSSSVEQRAVIKCILFAFRWNPGSSSVLLARAHRPDICLPSTGWHRTSDRGIVNYAVERDFSVPFWHIVFGRNDSGMIAHAFFCLQEDKLHPTEPRPDLQISNRSQRGWSFQGRSRVVFNGVRNLGQQAMELIFVCPKKVSDATVEAKFAELIPRLIEVEDKK